jgi:hypothetical protein
MAPDMPTSPKLQAGARTREEADAYLAELLDTHADVFLSFLTAELHPHIERETARLPMPGPGPSNEEGTLGHPHRAGFR